MCSSDLTTAQPVLPGRPDLERADRAYSESMKPVHTVERSNEPSVEDPTSILRVPRAIIEGAGNIVSGVRNIYGQETPQTLAGETGAIPGVSELTATAIEPRRTGVAPIVDQPWSGAPVKPVERRSSPPPPPAPAVAGAASNNVQAAGPATQENSGSGVAPPPTIIPSQAEIGRAHV